MTTSKPTIGNTSAWGTRPAVLALSLLLAAILAATLWAGTAHAANFNVTNTNDSGPGSLRQAILRANANSNPSEQDNINFNIPATDLGCAASGVCTISPQPDDLPDVTEPVVIDGYSQTGASPNTLAVGNDAALKVELSGEVAGGGANGLRVRASDCVVRGLIINRWSNEGVEINGAAGPGVSGNRVEGNFIGTDTTGEVGLGNANGVRLVDEASDNVVGGASDAARNVISGNIDGIEIEIGSNGNKIQGNYLGTDASGTEDLGNSSNGVVIRSSTDNVVGGTSAAARNVISGNDDDGVVLGSFDDGGNEIRGNYIGTDATGTRDLGNDEDGVDLEDDSLDNVVGGTSAAARNVISGNDDDGVELDNGANDRVQGNYVGTDASGQGDLGNGDEGVHVLNARNTTVGGTSAAASNTIAFNAGDGVDVDGLAEESGDPGTGNSILRNSIHSNGELGIDLNSDNENPFDVTPNDPQDPDPGPNLLQNFPLITSAETPNGQSITVRGSLNSNPLGSFNVRLFASPEADPSGYGEGERYLGQTNVTTDSGGNASFSFSSANASVPAGEVITATATNIVTGDTSEFSAAFEVEDGTRPTVVSTTPPDGATSVAPTVNITATFSEPMDPSTINGNSFRLFERVGATQRPVTAEVSYNATFRRAVLRPDEPLNRGSRYVAKVTTGARDLAGNRLAQTVTFTFTVRQ